MAILISSQREILHLVPASLFELLEQPKTGQHPAGVWGDMDPCTKRQDFRCPLENGNLEGRVCSTACDRTSQATDTRTDDYYMEAAGALRRLVSKGKN